MAFILAFFLSFILLLFYSYIYLVFLLRDGRRLGEICFALLCVAFCLTFHSFSTFGVLFFFSFFFFSFFAIAIAVAFVSVVLSLISSSMHVVQYFIFFCFILSSSRRKIIDILNLVSSFTSLHFALLHYALLFLPSFCFALLHFA